MRTLLIIVSLLLFSAGANAQENILTFDTESDLMKRFSGGCGHYIGMAVHDVGGSPRILEPGMVFANEPLSVFMEENLGVRVEDTIVITENGCENLTAGIPRTVEEIEAFMSN